MSEGLRKKKETKRGKRWRTIREDADHVLGFAASAWPLPTQCLRAQNKVPPQRLGPLHGRVDNLVHADLGPRPRRRRAHAKPAGEAVAAALLGLDVFVQVGAPVQALDAVVRVVVVEGVVELDHARDGLHAQLKRGARVLLAVRLVGVLEDHDLAVGRQGGLEEDVVGGDDGVVVVPVLAVVAAGQCRIDHVGVDIHLVGSSVYQKDVSTIDENVSGRSLWFREKKLDAAAVGGAAELKRARALKWNFVPRYLEIARQLRHLPWQLPPAPAIGLGHCRSELEHFSPRHPLSSTSSLDLLHGTLASFG